MPSPLRLSKISLEGFRGINEGVELSLDEKSAVIYGGNGAGKTSLLQSIEWGLYGQLPYMKGGEFDREDAIVNQFHKDGVAEVQLELENESRAYKILRRRSKGKDSAGASQLTLTFEGKPFKKGDAERRLVEAIGLSQDDFYATVYMHQDAVKTLITGSPRERSEVIDRLLGTRLLRDLSKALPLTILKGKRKELEKLAKEFEDSSSMEKLSEEKDSIEEYKETLIERGLSPEDFEPSQLARSLGEVSEALTKTALTIGVNVQMPGKPGREVGDMQEYSSTLIRAVSRVEDDLSRELKASREEVEQVSLMRDRYIDTLNSLASCDIDRFEDISANKRELENQIKELEAQIQGFKRERTLLEKESLRLNQLKRDQARIEEELDSYHHRLGGEEEIQKEISHLNAMIEELNDTIQRSQIYNQILAISIEYLGRFKPGTCPLCKTSTSPTTLSNSLKGELSKIFGGESLLDQRQRLRELKDKKTPLEAELSEYKALQIKLKQTLQEAEGLWNEVAEHSELDEADLERLDGEVSRLSNEIAGLESELIGLKGELLKIDSQGSLMKSLFTNFEKLKNSIKTVIQDWNEKQGLILLDKKIKTQTEVIANLEQQDIKMKEIKNKLLDLNQLISYHLRLDKVVRLEGGLPQLQRRLEELNSCLQRLTDLEEALTDIHHSIAREQKNCSDRILKEVQGSIRDYYDKILGHSYYDQLEIELETDPGGEHIYWIKGRGEKDSTYVRTRFSEAQLNATALAVFLAMVKHSTHHLDFTVFDDPTQSMDRDHKEALARLLCQEMENRQLIVATQDREFYQSLRKNINGSKAKCINMGDWTVKGPLLTIQSRMRSFLGLF